MNKLRKERVKMKKNSTEIEVGKVDAGTIARTIVLGLGLINMVIAQLGYVPLDIADSQVYQAVSDIVLIGGAVFAWWKNNPFTKNAKIAQETLKELKAGKDK